MASDRFRWTLAACVTTLGMTSLLPAAEPERNVKQAFLDPEQAGPDFQVQGEYLGTIGNETQVGAQVVALGDGKFDAVLYADGLPGAGWDGKTKVRLEGESGVGGTQLRGKNFKGTIRDGTLTGVAEEDVSYELKKVHRESPTLGAEPPAGAIALFDGTNVDAWMNGRIEEGELLGVGTRTRQAFRDFTLHLEFRTPFMPHARGQARGNSGMYLADQYECQILDSFGLEGEDNECGGIYKISRPTVNMCLPPLTWQTYDVEFRAARFNEAGEKVDNAVVTIRHNGIPIHEDLALLRTTPGGGRDDEKPGALYLQNHGDPVRFRNIWIIER